MKNLFLILFTALILFCSCSNDTSNNTPIIDVKSVIGKGAIHNTSEFIKDIKYVPLETGPNSIVGDIKKIVVMNNRIYVSDNQGKISIFDMSGRILNTLTRKGRGPQEYVDITDYTVDPKGNIFILASRDGIIEYDNDMKFVRKLNFESDNNNIFHLDISLIKEGLFASNIINYGTIRQQALTIYDDTLKVLVSYDTEVVTLDYASITIMPYNHYVYDGDMTIYRRVSDTIFNINIKNNYSKSVKYVLDYGGYALTEEIVKSKHERESNSISLTGLIEAEHYLFMIFDFYEMAPESFDIFSYLKNTYVYAVYDKKKGVCVLLNQPIPRSFGLNDDLTGNLPFWPKTITQDQKLVSWYNAVTLISLAEEGKIDKSLAANLKEDDNPVIVIATPK